MCGNCYKQMDKELADPIVDIRVVAKAPPIQKRCKRQGPCTFGHTTTSAQRSRGCAAWLAVPKGCMWWGAPEGSTLCGACFAAGMHTLGKSCGEVIGGRRVAARLRRKRPSDP